MKLKNKKLSYLLLVVFLLLFVWYFTSNREDFHFLSNIEPKYLLIIAAGHAFTIYTNGLLIKWLLEPFNKSISNYESFYVSLISSIGNFFLPAGSGLAMRAVYLKQKAGLGYKKFMTTLYGSYIVLFLCYGSAGLLSVFMIGRVGGSSAFYTLTATFGVMVIVTSYLTIFGTPKRLLGLLERLLPGVAKTFVEIIKGWNEVVAHRKLIFRLCVITLVWFLVALGINAAALKAIGAEIEIWPLTLMSAMAAISLLINVTPGSIGIREGLFIYSTGLLGLSVPQVLAASLLERGTKGIVLVVGWALTAPNWSLLIGKTGSNRT